MKKCRECGHEVSTEAQSCPQCGVPHPAAAPTSAQPSDAERPERELYRRDSFVVTTRRFVVGETTYAMRGVTSVALSKRQAAAGGCAPGFMGLLLGLMAYSTIIGAEVTAYHQWGPGILAGLLAAVLLVVANRQRKLPRPITYSVILTSASQERTAYSSTDEALVLELVEHLNRAIAARD